MLVQLNLVLRKEVFGVRAFREDTHTFSNDSNCHAGFTLAVVIFPIRTGVGDSFLFANDTSTNPEEVFGADGHEGLVLGVGFGRFLLTRGFFGCISGSVATVSRGWMMCGHLTSCGA